MQSWQLLSASKLNITLHESNKYQPLYAYNPHRGIINSAVYNHTNKVIASCGQDSRIELRSASSYEDQKLLQLNFHSITEEPTSINCLQFSHKSKYIAAGAANGLVKVWEMKSHKDVYKNLKGHTSAITSLAWVGNQNAIASSSTGGEIHIHRVSTGRLETLASRMQDGYNNIKVSQGEGFSRLAACTSSGSIMIWDLNATTKRPTYMYQDPQKIQITCLSISSFQPALLVAASLNSNLSFFDINHKKPLKTINTAQPLTAVCFHQNGHTISVGGMNGGLFVYDLRRPNENVSKYLGHQTSVKSVCFSTPSERQKDKVVQRYVDFYQRQLKEKETRISNIPQNEPKLPQTRETINKSNPHSHIGYEKQLKNKNLSSNPSSSKIPNLRQNNFTVSEQDKYSNSRISRTKNQDSFNKQKEEFKKIEITDPPVNPKFIKSTIPMSTITGQQYGSKDLKVMQQKIQEQRHEIRQLREQMHDRFDNLHLQIIRQMQMYMKGMISKIQESNVEKQELRERIKKLEGENESLRKRTY